MKLFYGPPKNFLRPTTFWPAICRLEIPEEDGEDEDEAEDKYLEDEHKHSEDGHDPQGRMKNIIERVFFCA